VINTNVMVNASGEVKWLSHGIFKSSCDISVEYFPFDIQANTIVSYIAGANPTTFEFTATTPVLL
jgi:hypothetical protein